MVDKKALAKNIFSNWANLIVGILISFFLAPFIVHKLGNTYYGIWVIVMQFTGYLYLLDFGIREFVIRHVSKNEASNNTSELSEIVSAGFELYWLIAAVCIIISVALAAYFPIIFDIPPEAENVAGLVAILTGGTIAQALAFNVYSGILMGYQRYDIFNKIGIVSSIVRLFLILGFMTAGYGIIALAAIQFTVGLAGSLVLRGYAKRLSSQRELDITYTRSDFTRRAPLYKELYKYSIFVLLNNVGQKAIFYTDALLIGIFMSAASVTFYAIAGSLVEYLRRLILISNNVLNPLASQTETKSGIKDIAKIIFGGARFSMLVALPISVTFLVLGDRFIGLWMGSEYVEQAYPVLAILSITTLLSVPHITITNVLYGISKHSLIAYLRITEAIANLLLSIILVQYIGITGVALGTAIPHLIIMVITLPLLTHRLINLNTGEYFIDVYIKPMLSIIPYAVTIIYMDALIKTESLLLFLSQIMICLPIYIISAWLLALKVNERLMITNQIRRRLTRNPGHAA